MFYLDHHVYDNLNDTLWNKKISHLQPHFCHYRDPQLVKLKVTKRHPGNWLVQIRHVTLGVIVPNVNFHHQFYQRSDPQQLMARSTTNPLPLMTGPQMQLMVDTNATPVHTAHHTQARVSSTSFAR